MSSVIYWFRQDLRLSDLTALEAALATGLPVVPVYIDDPATRPGAAACWWLHHSLQSLDRSLRARGSRLILRQGHSAEILARLCVETGAGLVFASRSHEPSGRRIERGIRNLRLVGGPSLFHPDQIKTQTGGTYGVYTPFVRNCLARAAPNPPVSATARIPAPALWPRSEELAAWNLCPRRPDWAAGWDNLWQPGESGAIAALQRFKVRAIQHYDTDRDRPDRLGTSRLSAHLHWGEISPNQLWYATQGADKFQAEILWREFALYLLWHRPELPDRCLRPEFERFGWRDDPPALAAWQQGRTGFPIVDAGMRELWQTGFMHNRVRMIVASFLTKHLLLPWQQGAAWFMETLLAADLAANAANWQWAAGCGVEAQPFFRIFNPVIQGRKFDPDGVYVRRFVPELRGQAGAAAYPPPLVDLAAARARALAEFARLR